MTTLRVPTRLHMGECVCDACAMTTLCGSQCARQERTARLSALCDLSLCAELASLFKAVVAMIDTAID